MIGWIEADWPAPPGIVAGTTTRDGGVSDAGFASLNLGAHVSDRPESVAENRARLVNALGLSQQPRWLDQVHGSNVLRVGRADEPLPAADASVTGDAGVPLVIMTADCLPVLFASRSGDEVGAAHGGWRSLAGGIIEKTVNAMTTAPGEMIAWLGPAISQPSFEVGVEVRDAFVDLDAALSSCFLPNERGRYQADLYAIARAQLAAAGVDAIYGGGLCTFSDGARFYSHRRDPRCGRMASVIQIRDK